MQVEAARWALLCGPIDGLLSVLGLTCHYKFQAPPTLGGTIVTHRSFSDLCDCQPLK